MTDEILARHAQLWHSLAGPTTVALGMIAALPSTVRVDVLRSVLAARPQRVLGPEADHATRWRVLSLGVVEKVLPAFALHDSGRTSDLRRFVEQLLSDLREHHARWAWLALRTLVRAGILESPDEEAWHEGLWVIGSHGDLAAELRGDPKLLGEPLWRLFALEGDRELSFANVDKYSKGERSHWLGALCELAGQGEIDRARLLAETIAALLRDRPAYRAMWFARLHDALAPTVAERSRHLGDYVRLVASRIPQVQAFGVRALAAAAKAGARLRPDQIDELEPAWSARQKGVVVAALQLAGALADEVDGAPRERVVRGMAQALGHADGDVQLAAWRALQARGLPPAMLHACVAPWRSGLSARASKQVAAALGDEDRAAGPPPVAPDGAAVVAGPIADSIAPIACFDELVRELSALVGGSDDPRVLERCLDGVLRHAAARPPDFARRTAGLRKLARRETPRCLQSFVGAWLDGRKLGTREGLLSAEYGVDLVAPLQPRLVEVLELARDAAGLPLLALPSRAPFLLDAATLSARLVAWATAGRRPGPHDLVQAMRRVSAAERALVMAGLPDGLRGAAAAALVPPHVLVCEPRMQWCQGDRGPRWRRCRVHCSGLSPGSLHPLEQVLADVVSGVAPDGNSFAPWWPNEFETPLLLRALAGLAPHDGETLATLGALRIGWNLDGGSVARADVAFLEPLLQPTAAWGPNTHLLVAMALGAKAPEMHGIAIDVVLQALRDGRLDAAGLGAALGRLFAMGFVPGQRFARSLRTIAGAGAAAAASVFAWIEAMLVGPVEDVVREVGELLTLACELAAEGGRVMRAPAARTFLAALAATGSGKAGKLARELLAGDPTA